MFLTRGGARKEIFLDLHLLNQQKEVKGAGDFRVLSLRMMLRTESVLGSRL